MAKLSDYVGIKVFKAEEFLSSGTWTHPSGVDAVFLLVVGGGGGGTGYEGSGGGGGACVSTFAPVSADVTITIGAGGAGGNSAGSNPGGDGSDSTFGSLVTAKGGFGTPTTQANIIGGAGGGMGASIGLQSISALNDGGAGGHSYGRGAPHTLSGVGANADANSGAGGAGGAINNVGGNGGSGRIIVAWFE